MAKEEDRLDSNVASQAPDATETLPRDDTKKSFAKGDERNVAKIKVKGPRVQTHVGKDMENPHGNEGEGSTSGAKKYGEELVEYVKTHDSDAAACDAAKDVDAGRCSKSSAPKAPTPAPAAPKPEAEAKK